MDVYIIKPLAKREERLRISRQEIRTAIEISEKSGSRTHIGHNIYKVRVAKPGRGKSAGCRIAYGHIKNNDIIICALLEKNSQDNFTNDQIEAVNLLINKIRSYSESELTSIIEKGILERIS